MQLVVVGFHRSGTSLLTQLLHTSGLFVGDVLLGARPSNPYGHFEDREVLDLHQEILDDHGVSWHVDDSMLFTLSARQWQRMADLVGRRDAQHATWGFKEPRSCFFLGAWKYLMPDSKYVVVYRDPADTVQSLETRQGAEFHAQVGPVDLHRRFFTEPDHGLKMWLAYNRAIVAFARAHVDDCLVLPVTRLYEGFPVVREVNRRLGLDLAETPTEAVFDARVTSGRDQPQWVHTDGLAEEIAATWNDLLELTDATEAA